MKRKLGNDPSLWPQQIMEFLYSDYPFVAEYMDGIKFKTIDPKSGTAMGAIILNNKSTGVGAVVPIIISEFSMSDLSVFVFDDEQYIPLTETRLVEYLGKSIGKLKRSTKQKGSMPVKTSPPGHDSTGGKKTASMFKAATGQLGIGPGMLKIIMDAMGSKEDGLIASRVQSLIKDIPYRAIWISYVNGEWKAKASDNRFNITEVVGREKIISTFEKYDDNLSQEMDRTNNIFITNKERKPFIANEFLEAPTRLTQSGTAAVITSNNESKIGYYCANVTDLLGRPTGVSMWYDGTNYSMNEEMSGYYLRDSHSPRVVTLKSNSQYSFSFTKEGKYYCTSPFTVLNTPEVKGEGLVFKAKTHFGKEITINYSKEVEEPLSSTGAVVADMPVETSYYIPTSYKLNKVGSNKVTLTYLTDKSFANVLADNLGDSIRVYGFNEGGIPHYYINGKISTKFIKNGDIGHDPKFGKYAGDENVLMWYLINLGLSEGGAKSVVSAVWENGGEATVGNVEYFKEGSLDMNLPEELVQLAEDKLIPEDSVESLLGLGFINDLDVLDALAFTDEIKSLESVLAKLLFQIRLGVPLADESNVTRALEYVSMVIDELEMTKITLEKKVGK